ncbi:MAG TPA: mechanosensitive ion channel [Fulvivirga sp.]|nr:mechanosensitive ion channel [Fulvivirga sp.]
MEKFKLFVQNTVDFFEKVGHLFTIKLFSIGKSDITISTILFLIVSVFILIYLARKLSEFLGRYISNRYGTTEATSHSIATIIRYSILVIGLMVVVQTAGIDLSTLSIMAGALGVGIGFGLQNITNNFISGLIILFEQPIKVGDRIEVGNIVGEVKKISARATMILTNDNIIVIVPNSEFISSTVINWSHNDRSVAFRFQVGVAYKEDPAFIKKLLLEVSSENEGVLDNPAPEVLFDEFGESSLNFNLRVWTYDYANRPTNLKSQLYYSIFEKFKEHGVEIPFPQRDLHLKSGVEKIR